MLIKPESWYDVFTSYGYKGQWFTSVVDLMLFTSNSTCFQHGEQVIYNRNMQVNDTYKNNEFKFKLPMIGIADNVSQLFEIYDEYINIKNPNKYILSIREVKNKITKGDSAFPMYERSIALKWHSWLEYQWVCSTLPYIGADLNSSAPKCLYEFVQIGPIQQSRISSYLQSKLDEIGDKNTNDLDSIFDDRYLDSEILQQSINSDNNNSELEIR